MFDSIRFYSKENTVEIRCRIAGKDHSFTGRQHHNAFMGAVNHACDVHGIQYDREWVKKTMPAC